MKHPFQALESVDLKAQAKAAVDKLAVEWMGRLPEKIRTNPSKWQKAKDTKKKLVIPGYMKKLLGKRKNEKRSGV